MTIEILLITFIIFQIIDVAETLYMLKIGGKEMNPIMREVMELLGSALGLVVFKALLIGLAIAMIDREGIEYALGIFNVFYLFVCGWNLYQIKRQREINRRKS